MVNGKALGTGLEFLKKMAYAAGGAAVADGAVEVSHIPFLNDQSPAVLGLGPGKSNFEAVVYTGSLLMIGGGALDWITGHKLGGIDKTFLPAGIGAILGTMFYEHHLARYIPNLRVP
jgi:hypothetical protein